MGPPEALMACKALQCTKLLLLLSMLLTSTVPEVQAHPETLLEGAHNPSSSSTSTSTRVAAPSKPLISMSSKLTNLPWKQHQHQLPLQHVAAPHLSKNSEKSNDGKHVRAGFGNGQPLPGKQLPKALAMEHLFLGLDPHGPFPDVPVPAAGQQPAFQPKLSNGHQEVPRHTVAARDDVKPTSPQLGLTGPSKHQRSNTLDQTHLASPKRNLLHDEGDKAGHKDGMPEGTHPKPSVMLLHVDAAQNDFAHDKRHVVVKVDRSRPLKSKGPGMQGVMGNPSMPPSGLILGLNALDPRDQKHKHSRHARHLDGHTPEHRKPGQTGTAPLSLGNPSMHSPGYTVAVAEEQHGQYHPADGKHHSTTEKPLHSQSNNGERDLPPPMGTPNLHPADFIAGDNTPKQPLNNGGHHMQTRSSKGSQALPLNSSPSMAPHQVIAASDAAFGKADKHSRPEVKQSTKHLGTGVPMLSTAGVSAPVPLTSLATGSHGADQQQLGRHHERSLLTTVDALSDPLPQKLLASDLALAPQIDSALTVDSQSESMSRTTKTAPPAAAASPAADNKANKKDGGFGDRVSRVTSASGLPAIRIDFRSKAAREKQQNQDALAATTVVQNKGGSPNANLLEGFQPVPIADPGMLAAMLSGPPGMAGQWGAGWGR